MSKQIQSLDKRAVLVDLNRLLSIYARIDSKYQIHAQASFQERIVRRLGDFAQTGATHEELAVFYKRMEQLGFPVIHRNQEAIC
ncbi:MAG: hypothetical protein A3C85_00870 [Candidatus Doudnabacteria bacterium RIFCSPHIGHO2_02_FULL_48_21]|uniref:Uncharacterized protein n=1 Tax=Candidatus Doudnabacteria bacterium RIFCSPLOWO2_02_FULL_48_13 TaxID=1817845 RepID=A0A1F5QB71_9BACT|nr:MAG: hypothetical protein A3K05_01805 [Candidatus Doudnabacteria bacterium RIFCSPHIGHO2_01_48_18]OGE77315.1 MAG: hypothetical protein A2668_02715 [Candidatus Doudnabacteria bacterium RIFCSPHIGHO2_01_FULL_48_180]OGE91005.1 MAG: hypothetical protein A3F44_01620 [Candidatus Doudnabacteria bacterium RIFCSPHIGHO2_12_FULL_47_25]OGE92853.1 MAG: hypothetical protein A3C85_00870 [Candidatus Doudnabacteria bacterium RIFCSPHIGHO2_02_FULL_48_21]OGE96886.1 MAG: hypothetical protein A3A83_04110 [Candidatu